MIKPFTDIIAAKRVKTSDINLVIPRVNWQSKVKYTDNMTHSKLLMI